MQKVLLLRLLAWLIGAIFCTHVVAKNVTCGDSGKKESANVASLVPDEVMEAAETWKAQQTAAQNVSFVTLRITRAPLDLARRCRVGKVNFGAVASVLVVEWACPSQANGFEVYAYPFLVCELRAVPVARMDISRLTTLGPDEVTFAQRNVAFGIERGMNADDFGDEPVYRARRFLREGQVFGMTDIEQIPPVRRNKQVTVRVDTPELEIEQRGVALADGRVGEIVRVRNATNGKIFSAAVAGKDLATLTVR
ncbi:MAG TPA: flagellar basal body P-ring formation chaperone FlgA [Rhodocyclaceae bacterium]|nr:flagellar basal body P-ring formation chaperone FlgA [Rhodocyclaceae bacterium]